MPDQLDQYISPKTENRPTIYAYSDNNPQYSGLLKVGYTAKTVEQRLKQQYPTLRPHGKKPYTVVFTEPAFYTDGGTFTDHDVHRMLEKKGIRRVGGEWFRCTAEDVRVAWQAVRSRTENVENRTETFSMRPEQKAAVQKTLSYFQEIKRDPKGRTPKFLWNAKMRFGKTFAAYQLAKQMKAKKVLILTFKPAVQAAWRDDLLHHVDFEGWQFIASSKIPNDPQIDAQYNAANKRRPIVCFGSFQDFLGVDRTTGEIKGKNEWVHSTVWDLVIFDEYHFGAWREKAQKLFENENDEDSSYDTFDPESYDRANARDESFLPITTKHYLYLSGTPFRALNSGEFIEEQIFNWTYSDEQRSKEEWQGADRNPYEELPRMVMMTYKIPDSIRQIAIQGEYDEFDLNTFFSAEGTKARAKFQYEEYVQKWLDLIRGAYIGTAVDDLKLGNQKPAMPFSDTRLLDALSHTFWLLPNVASCWAMANLLKKPKNEFYRKFNVNICAGTEAGIGLDALDPVLESMEDPLESRTITLSCGKLTTGVTVPPWTGVFMLRNLKSPETYFQTAFRVQSPWTIKGENPNDRVIVKENCYLFDFAPDRALKQVAEYACQLDLNESNPEKKVASFISFLPIIAYDGSTMKQIDAAEILDQAIAGTSATLLARRWESALLVNVDNDTLQRLIANEEAMNALMKIEGFRNLNRDIETIINKSEAVKAVKKDAENRTKKELKEANEEEKELKSKRKEIQEKLIKFATRIPIFMYLSDFRERSLEDVITKVEPGLFRKVTGLEVEDFDLLRSLNVFNSSMMNDAVWKFKRYEDASLEYTGINSKHDSEEEVGLFNTVLTKKEFLGFAEAQRRSAHLPPDVTD